ncbi:MAG: sigma-70 family RNA polymerase sigma factor [Planctomycetes bacterium]|nr:sigma-70 family RNA polymerase sigma factor [Planctomycetota bacterium]
MGTNSNSVNSAIDEVELKPLLMERAEQLHQRVRRRIPVRLQSTISPDDILQEVWIAAFRGVGSLRNTGPDSVDRWLSKIVQRRLLDAIRDARRIKRGGQDRFEQAGPRQTTSYVDLFTRVAGNQRTPSSEVATREAVHAVQIALGTLPPDYREAITLHHLDGCSCQELAEVMQKSHPAVHSLLYRGLRMLRQHLGTAGRFFSDDA